MSVDPTRIDLEATFSPDPLVRRMRGYAYHGNTPFDVPFISQITENLWTGGCEEGLVLPDFFEHVVSLYPWEKYAVLHALKSLREIKLYDSTDQAMEQVDEIAAWVNTCVADGPTLVHCQAGLNRSALVAARALILGGMPAHEAILLLRAKRSPAVLCNTAFQKWLLA